MRLPKLALVACALAACALSLPACGGSDNTAQNANAGALPANAAAPSPTAAARPAATPDEFAAVRGIYASTCQNCHQPGGAGGTVQDEATGKSIKVPTLRAGDAARHTDAQLARKISNGDPDEGMPAFKSRLSPEQIDQLVRFIRTEFQGQAAAATGAAGAGANASAPAR